ncbi:antibiotic biosynthesis monooxygenase [Streptomyces marispadix]|uniref:Antibiotic biosynthesis monooxygenase n=1 Tax=Streptomyces marispadix TaxID=2922868 RepID=A0ABS9SXF4_9ACTN|nr:antibiotic biosynthesis monooxygenase [Streptomyces marispadix]MCH6160959.1 antibiotic biosynthesis monooxygenase [Streptomyces marispadix]
MTATERTTAHPDPAREDSRVAFFSRWHLPGPEAGRAALDAIAAVWEREPWPSPGLLGYHLYEGEDGGTLLHHSQWTGEDAYEDYVRDHRGTRNEEIDAAVPGIERLGLGRYRHYRGGRAEGDSRVPGCVVTVSVEFDGPDPDRQRAWVDAVFEALRTDPQPPPGGVSAHFHLSTDGERVLNYAEWESAQAHADALAAPGRGIGGPTAEWERVQRFPGLKRSSVRRYRHVYGLVPR